MFIKGPSGTIEKILHLAITQESLFKKKKIHLILYHPLYAESEKKWYKGTCLQNRNRLTENEFMVARAEENGKGIVRKLGLDMHALLYLKWITSKDLLLSAGNSAQRHVAAWMAGEFGGERIQACAWLSSLAVHLKLSEHCWLAVIQYKIKSLKEKFSLMCREIKTSAVPRAASF